MTAIMHRSYNVVCNGPDSCRAILRGRDNESRAAVRRRAVKAGWTHVRSYGGRRADDDFCPQHKPEQEG